MEWYDDVCAGLKKSDVDYVAYLPDSTVWPLIRVIEEDGSFDTVLVAREEEAVGILSGAWLGGRRGSLICQSSGLSNTFNALGSLNKPWGIPFIGLVSRRGHLDEHNLAQVACGYGMPRLLDAIGIRNANLDGSVDVEKSIIMATNSAFSTEDPFVFLLESTLTGGKA